MELSFPNSSVFFKPKSRKYDALSNFCSRSNSDNLYPYRVYFRKCRCIEITDGSLNPLSVLYSNKYYNGLCLMLVLLFWEPLQVADNLF